MTTEWLQSALSFTAADLEENRAGRLSSAQQGFMTDQSNKGKSYNLAMGGVFVVFVVIIVAVVLPKMNSNSSGSSGSSSAVPPGIVFGVLAVVAVVVALTLVRTRRGMDRLKSGTVYSVEGAARTRARSYADANQLSDVSTFRLTVGDVTFALSSAHQLAAFEEGASYRCYYVKGTLPVLISAERA